VGCSAGGRVLLQSGEEWIYVYVQCITSEAGTQDHAGLLNRGIPLEDH
jgi:hypothetical protein